jgi:hypothetical protein
MWRDSILGIVSMLGLVALVQREPASIVRAGWVETPTAEVTWTEWDGALALHQARQAILARGAGVAPSLRATTGRRLNAVASRVDGAASRNAPEVAARLAVAFGVAPEMLIAEQQQLGASWGDLTIAMTLSTLSAEPVAAPQLLELRQSGAGWGRIAAGLGLDLEQVVATARSIGRGASAGSRPASSSSRTPGFRSMTGWVPEPATLAGPSPVDLHGGGP